MPRLRHKRTGVVVVVDDATAAALAGRYEPVGGKPESGSDSGSRKTRQRRRSSD